MLPASQATGPRASQFCRWTPALVASQACSSSRRDRPPDLIAQAIFAIVTSLSLAANDHIVPSNQSYSWPQFTNCWCSSMFLTVSRISATSLFVGRVSRHTHFYMIFCQDIEYHVTETLVHRSKPPISLTYWSSTSWPLYGRFWIHKRRPALDKANPHAVKQIVPQHELSILWFHLLFRTPNKFQVCQ